MATHCSVLIFVIPSGQADDIGIDAVRGEAVARVNDVAGVCAAQRAAAKNGYANVGGRNAGIVDGNRASGCNAIHRVVRKLLVRSEAVTNVRANFFIRLLMSS